MSDLDLPDAGDLRRGAFTPFEWRCNVRSVAVCERCARPVAHWRRAGVPRAGRVLCNGESKPACGQIAHQAHLERERLLAKSPEVRAANRKRSKDARRAQELAAQEAARLAEVARLALCPRPDKEPWLTLEAAEEVVVLMRRAGRPRARDLHGYECPCGRFHVGDRTRWADDPVVARWGSAYEEAS